MTSDEVLSCLYRRWPDSDYLCIREAPDGPDRRGRKLDLLAIALWQSRGLQLDGVEIKVSLSDWKRELHAAAKADWWWRHVHRFWVAVPSEMAEKVKPELPDGWGLLACATDAAPKVSVKPPSRIAEPLAWSHTVGLLRAAADAGRNALFRAEQRGREEGRRRGLEEAERNGMDGVARRELENLRHSVIAFEEAAGVKISDRWRVGHIGAAVALVLKEFNSPGWALGHLAQQAAALKDQAGAIQKEAARVERLADLLAAAAKPQAQPMTTVTQ